MSSALLPEGTTVKTGPINQAEVFAVCESLIRDRVQITTERVRERLGHRGSNSTISKYVSMWRAQPAETAVVVPSPAPMPAGLEAPMRALLDQAQARAYEQFSRERELLEAERAELDARHESDLREIARVRMLNDQLNQVVEKVVARLERVEAAAAAAAEATQATLARHLDLLTEKLAPLASITDILALAGKTNEAIANSQALAEQNEAKAAERGAATVEAMEKLGTVFTGAQDFFLRAVEEARDINTAQQVKFDQVNASIVASHKATSAESAGLLKAVEALRPEITATAKRQENLESRVVDVLSEQAAVQSRLEGRVWDLAGALEAVARQSEQRSNEIAPALDGISRQLSGIAEQLKPKDEMGERKA